MSFMKDMPFKTPEQLGSALRIRRMERAMSQVELAERLGVERKWIMKVEAGNPKAEFGFILKTFAELRLEGKITIRDASRSVSVWSSLRRVRP